MTVESGQLRADRAAEAAPPAGRRTTLPHHERRARLRLVPRPAAAVDAERWSGLETKECS